MTTTYSCSIVQIMSRSAEQQAPLSSETQRLVEHLGRDGYAVYKTSGKTPASLQKRGDEILVSKSRTCKLNSRTGSFSI